MKKLFNILFSITVLTGFLIPTIKPNAKTLNDFQKELDQKKAEYNKNKNEQNSLNNSKNISQKEIASAQKEIKQAEDDMIATGNKIQQLDADIEKKNIEIKELMKLVQLSDGDISYLEYAFGAADMTDFIHRVSMAEELTAYNDKLVKEMNQMVEQSKQLQVELKQKQEKLNAKIQELNKKIASYNAKIEDLSDIQVDVLEEINSLQKTVNYYKNQGCSPNQDINTCLGNNLPYDTAFWRPVSYGYVSSEYGYRNISIYGYTKMHYGTDMGVGKRTTNVYASAGGKVAVVNSNNSNSCGGNYVLIHHNIKGTEYTTAYLHLYKVYVSVGQQVTKDTVIGLAGGNNSNPSLPGYTPWDGCSTGQHAHLTIGKGLQLSISSLYSHSFNPRTLVNFPAIGSGKYWNDRTTKF